VFKEYVADPLELLEEDLDAIAAEPDNDATSVDVVAHLISEYKRQAAETVPLVKPEATEPEQLDDDE